MITAPLRCPALFVLLFLAVAVPMLPGQSATSTVFVLDGAGAVVLAPAKEAKSRKSDPGEVDSFDASRNAASDIRQALSVARKEGKRVLVEAGGDWCIWCQVLDIYFAGHPDLLAFRKAHYVTVKVATNGKDRNARVLQRYAPVEAYPHFFVLDSHGDLVVSQATTPLEQGRAYHHGRLLHFLHEYAPPEALAALRNSRDQRSN